MSILRNLKLRKEPAIEYIKTPYITGGNYKVHDETKEYIKKPMSTLENNGVYKETKGYIRKPQSA